MEQLTAHWSWAGLKRAFESLRVDLTGLQILSPNLRERLQNLHYATGTNLTEHRIMVREIFFFFFLRSENKIYDIKRLTIEKKFFFFCGHTFKQ